MNKKEKFLYALPHNFNRQKYLEVANTLSIPAKTAEGYIPLLPDLDWFTVNLRTITSIPHLRIFRILRMLRTHSPWLPPFPQNPEISSPLHFAFTIAFFSFISQILTSHKLTGHALW